jgi:predicted MFS family arabinose efflux permease
LAHVSSAGAWLWLGVVSLAAAALLWAQFRGTVTGAPGGELPALRWSGESIRLVACYGAFGFGYIIPATFLSAMAREAASSSSIYAWSWPLFGAAAAASTFVAAALRRRLADRSIWIAGHLVMAAGVVVPLAWPGFTGVVLSGLLVGGTFMVVTMVGIQEARRIAGPGARALIAAMTAAFAVGQIAGPLLVSALAARGYGFAPALWIAGAALVASAAVLLTRSGALQQPD